MTLGQVVDFCYTWNKVNEEPGEEKKKAKKRKATQADWDAFLG